MEDLFLFAYNYEDNISTCSDKISVLSRKAIIDIMI